MCYLEKPKYIHNNLCLNLDIIFKKVALKFIAKYEIFITAINIFTKKL